MPEVTADERQFRRSEGTSVGIELELQLVRARDFDLARDAVELIERLEKCRLPGAVKLEITEGMIELNTSIHASYPRLREELRALRDAVVREAGILNLYVVGGGSHPFHDWTERRITPSERFNALFERYRFLAQQFTVFGQHAHVGCADGDQAVYLVHMLTRYVPHFIALSASSPYYQGEDTAFQSSRLTAVSAFPLAGHMPFVADWAAFLEYYEKMRNFGIVASMKDFYWDIRPKPEYGTIEVRVFDTPLTVDRAGQLAAYAQALAAFYVAERPQEPSRAVYLVNSHNRFEACRYGFLGEIVDPYAGRKKRIGEDILETIDRVLPHAKPLGSTEALADLAALVRHGRSDSDRLRALRGKSGALEDVVRESAAIWAGSGENAR